MRVSLVVILSLVQLSLASVSPKGACHADNCLRALRGTVPCPTRLARATKDCKSFFVSTVTPRPSTTTITFVETVTVADPITKKSKRSLVVSPVPTPHANTKVRAVPSYASACSGTVRYSSACSCLGVTKGVTTASAKTVSVTTTVTVSKHATIVAPSKKCSTESSSSKTSSRSSSTTPTSSKTGTSTSTTPTVSSSAGFHPTLPSSYSECVADPGIPSTSFELLETNNGLPIINNKGRASLATKVDNNLGKYHFSKPAGVAPGLYDIVFESSQGTSFFAISSTGEVDFISASSNGQVYVPRGSTGGKYITSIWSLQCNGILRAGIIGGAEFRFKIENNNLFAKKVNSGSAKRSLRERQDDSDDFDVVVLPTQQPAAFGVDTPRCPSDQAAVTKIGARGPEVNGCGDDTFKGHLVPNLFFKSGCDNHDRCYDDCSKTFVGCNNAFLSDNLDICAKDFPNGGILRWGCEKLGQFYAYEVTTDNGRAAFQAATSDRCTCDCHNPQLVCKGDCISADDPDNCGKCGNVCPPGSSCSKGECSCPDDKESCNGSCFDLTSDSKNCGSCGNSCPSGSSCLNSECSCAAPSKACSGECIDVLSDPENCGTCGNVCSSGSCEDGQCQCVAPQESCDNECVDLSTDTDNCGSCGNKCPSGTSCSGSQCQCPNSESLCSDQCVDLLGDTENCGACGNVCPSGSVCNNGACSSIFCTGQTCQNFSACGPGGSCVCASTTDGTGFCVDGSTPCSGLPSCSTTAQCGVGEVCAVQTCCGTPVCVGAAACGGVDLPSSALLLREREWVNGTIASPGVWVP